MTWLQTNPFVDEAFGFASQTAIPPRSHKVHRGLAWKLMAMKGQPPCWGWGEVDAAHHVLQKKFIQQKERAGKKKHTTIGR